MLPSLRRLDFRAPSVWAAMATWIVLIGALAYAFAPAFRDLSAYGFQDFDAHAVYRYITVVSLLEHGEPPWWHPYMCGGFPAFAYSEGTPNFLSPFLPLYLFFPIQVAIRLEGLAAVIIALAGTYVLARRFCAPPVLAAFAVLLFVFNGRTWLHVAATHSWHWQYAWMPWALYFFHRSLEPRAERFAILCGVVVAIQLYVGAIYPLPHTVLLLFAWTVLMSVQRRELRPIAMFALTGVVGGGLSAPRLLPLIDLMMRYPRLSPSTEAMSLEHMVIAMTRPIVSNDFENIPGMGGYLWHEYGIFVTAGGVGLMGFALWAARPGLERALQLVAILLVALGCGAFHPLAPWTLLHKLPIFASHHVPMRFLYPATLIAGVLTAVVLARIAAPWFARFAFLHVVAVLPLAVLAGYLASYGHDAMARPYCFVAPQVPRAETFIHHATPVYKFNVKSCGKDPRDWNATTLLAMFNNTGVLKCYGLPAIDKGALPVENPLYRGEAFLSDGVGTARIVERTTNFAAVEVTGARPGALVVFNMNYEVSWHVNGEPALRYQDKVAAPVPAGGAGVVRFAYWPRTFPLGVLLFFLTAWPAIALWRRRPWSAVTAQ